MWYTKIEFYDINRMNFHTILISEEKIKEKDLLSTIRNEEQLYVVGNENTWWWVSSENVVRARIVNCEYIG